MTGPNCPARATVPWTRSGYRPLYARLLGLRFVNPGGVLCFLFFEGAIALAVLLALAELVTWWAVLVLPVVVAAMVKLNDMVAAIVVHSAALVPEQERDRFRRQIDRWSAEPGWNGCSHSVPGVVITADPVTAPAGQPVRLSADPVAAMTRGRQAGPQEHGRPLDTPEAPGLGPGLSESV